MTTACIVPAPAVIYWPMLVKDFWDPQPVNVVAHDGLCRVIAAPRLSPSFMKELQSAVWSVNPSLPIANARTLEAIRASSMAQTSFALTMLAIAAGVALLLGVVGIYGVIVYIAAQRTREIGIRMALGAESGDVSRLFLRHGLMLTGYRLVHRHRRVGGSDALHVNAAVRRQRHRSGDLRRGLGDPRGHRIARHLAPRAPRLEGRPHGGAQNGRVESAFRCCADASAISAVAEG